LRPSFPSVGQLTSHNQRTFDDGNAVFSIGQRRLIDLAILDVESVFSIEPHGAGDLAQLEANMVSHEQSLPLHMITRYHVVPLAPLDADFDRRWAVWIERGHLHDRRVRHALAAWAGGLATVAAMIYMILRG